MADMALYGGHRKRYGSFSPSLRCLYPSYGNFTLSSVLWGHPTAYDAFATLLSLLGIPQITRFCGHRRLSPGDIVTLYSMNRSLTSLQLPSAHQIADVRVAFRGTDRVGLRVITMFRRSILSLLPHFLRFTHKVTLVSTRFVAGDWLGLTGPGFLRLVTLPFAGRTRPHRSLSSPGNRRWPSAGRWPAGGCSRCELLPTDL